MFKQMFSNITPITKNIIILNVVVYLASNFLMFPKLYELLSVFYIESPHFKAWQIITHMFMHAPLEGNFGITHILFNMFTLLSFGPVLEQTLGEKKYVFLYFASGIGAYFLNCGWNFVEITQLGVNPEMIYNTPMLGASGAIAGVVAAFAVLFPDAKISMMFIPIGIKAKYLMTAAVVISLYLGFTGNAGESDRQRLEMGQITDRDSSLGRVWQTPGEHR